MGKKAKPTDCAALCNELLGHVVEAKRGAEGEKFAAMKRLQAALKAAEPHLRLEEDDASGDKSASDVRGAAASGKE